MSVVNLANIEAAYAAVTITDQIANLPPGETYTRAVFLPAFHVKEGVIQDVKRQLTSNLTQMLARARQRTGNRYSMHGIHTFTHNYDVVVAVVIVRHAEDDDEEGEL